MVYRGVDLIFKMNREGAQYKTEEGGEPAFSTAYFNYIYTHIDTQVHWLAMSLLTQVKEGIKDLIHSCHCLSHSPDFCLLIEPRAFDMMHRYSLSLHKAPRRRCKRFPEVLSIANTKDWDVCTY